VPLLLCEFHEQHPDVRVRLTVSDTQTLVDQVANRDLELGIVGAARRHRGVTFEPFFRDEVVLACPAGHRLAGKTISLDDLKNEQLIVMQEGAGVRQVIEDELRKAGLRLRDLDISLELGLQESVRSAVLAGHGVAFISRLAVDADLDEGRVATARVRGLDPVREIFLARASGRSETRAARAFVAFAQERLPA
jgi:DNA-binding transcriptional LysR family regulator